MDIELRKKGKICILDVTGEVKLGEDDQLGQKCKELLEAGERLFVFNMLRVPWLDSSGLGETVACHKRIRERGGTLKIAVRGKVHELFVLVFLHRTMDVFEDVEDALASFAP